MNSRQPNRGPDRLSRSLTLARGFASASALLLVLFGVVPAAIAAPGWQSMPELRNHSNALGMKQAQGQNSQPSASFPDQVVALTNAERAAAGLPPLKSNAILMKAADSHSQAMAVGHYMAHEDPNTGTNPGQRITAAGYKWTTVGENVAAGQDSPQQVVMSWMGSPGHRANILNSAFREIGVGYAYDPNDTSGCGDLGCKHYWTQNFGASADGFPLVINGETPSTDVNTVNLFLYGGDWAREMRLSNDGGPFTAWEPFTSNLSWKLLNQPGLRTVTGEIRDGSRVSTASDTILLSPQSQAVTPSPGDSHTAVQQASTSTTGAQISLSTSTASPATTAQQVPSPGQVDEVVLDRQVSASKVGVTDELTITLTLSPTNFTCDRVVRRTPADVVLVVDRSSSMLDSLGVLGASKLEGAKQAAKIFVDQMDKTKDQIGLVQFNEQADLVGQLTGDTSATKASIDSMTGDDGTNISAGISTAYKELTGGRHRTEAIRVIVLLSDGQSESGPATQAADLAKSEGSRIVTIGLGADADQALLRGLASKPADYYFAPSTDKLIEVYRSIAQSIQEFAPVSSVLWEHKFDATSFELVPASVSPPAQVTGNIITWRLNRLTNKGSTVLSYRVKPRVPGSFNLDRGDRMSFLRCEQIPRELALASGLPITVQGSGGALGPGDIINGAVCGGFPWWLLLALVLIVLFMVLILWRNLAGIRSWLTDKRQMPRWCQAVALLLLAYLLFLLSMLLGHLVTPTMCSAREAIYFTRVDANGKSTVMVKPLDPDRPASELVDIQKANCPSCHVVVAPDGKYLAALAEGGNTPISIINNMGEIVNIPSITGSYASWSPDSTKLAYAAGDRDIYILDLGTGQSAPVTGASSPQFVETMPAWSRDGRRIAFVRPVSGSANLQSGVPTDIYAVPAEGGVATLVAGASGTGFNYFPTFSPDGRWLAFTRHTTGTSSTYTDDAAELYMVPADGGEPKRLAANDGPGGQTVIRASNSWPAWSPSSRRLAFGSKRNGQYDIYTTTIDPSGDSGEAQSLVGANDPNSFDHLPSWGPALSRDLVADLLNLWPWLIPIPILLLFALLLCRRKGPIPPLPHSIALDRKVTPPVGYIKKSDTGDVLKRDQFRVELTLTGEAIPCPDPEGRKPVDVALVIDTSGSMGSSEKARAANKLQGAKRAAKSFVEKLDMARDRIALVPFDDSAQIVLPLNKDANVVKSSVDGLALGGGTSVDRGIEAGHEALEKNKRSEADRIIVLLSDGQSTREPAVQQAESAKTDGIRIITIGLGDDADKALLKELASKESDFHFAPDSTGLEAIYSSIALEISNRMPATDVNLEHNYDASRFRRVGMIYPTPAMESSGSIVWRFGQLVGERKLTYFLEPLEPGPQQQIVVSDRINYRQCGSTDRTLSFSKALPVEVIGMVEGRPRIAPVKSAPDPLPIKPPEVYWQPDSAFIIGVGGTGRWVLTHLKKNLLDAGAGTFPQRVKMVVVDTSEYELMSTQGVQQQVPVQFAGVHISPDQVVKLDENLSSVIAKLRDEPELAEWMPNYGALPPTQKDLGQGTYGRRPLARAGLVRDVQKLAGATSEEDIDTIQKAASRIWQLLLEGVTRVSPEGGLRIIVVGSLAGGMSGVLWDVAYLARKAALVVHGANVGTNIEGYFATDRAFFGIQGLDAQRLGANTFGALRELRRFQLNPGIGYQMKYKRDANAASAPVLNSNCDWKLFDDVFLFGQHYAVPGQPSNGAFASIADIVSLRLDKAARAVGAADWYSHMRNAVGGHQQAHREMAVGSAGSFVYRLPAYDIMQTLKLKWVRALLEAFLMGQAGSKLSAEGAAPANDPGLLAATHGASDPRGLVPVFLQGWIDTEDRQGGPQFSGIDANIGGNVSTGAPATGQQEKPHWHGASALAYLMWQEDRTREFEVELDEAQRDPVAESVRAFEDELVRVTAWVLNGTSEATTIAQSRVGKVEYARNFLRSLVSELNEVQGRISKMGAGASPERTNKLAHLEAIRVALAASALMHSDSLEAITQALVQAAGANEEGGTSKTTPGLYRTVVDQASNLEPARDNTTEGTWRRQMNGVRVRKYLWTTRVPGQNTDREIADLLYSTYAVGQNSPEEYVQYLWWDIRIGDTDPANRAYLALTLRIREENKERIYQLRTIEDAQTFCAALLDMAGTVLQEAWANLWDDQTLRHVAESHGLLEQRNSPIAAAFRESARPTVAPDLGAAPRRSILAVADPALQRVIEDPIRALLQGATGQDLGRLEPLSSTDKTAIQLMSTIDAVPLDSIPMLLSGPNSAFTQYISSSGERSVAYPEEVQAETWEAPRNYDQDRLVLHPLIVAGLADPRRARCFALAYAAGFIFEEDKVVKLQGPSDPESTVVVTDDNPAVDGLVWAFLTFTLDDRWGPGVNTSVENLCRAVEQPSDQTQSRWKSDWGRQVPPTFNRDRVGGAPDHDDLGRLIYRVVGDTLVESRRREQRGG